MLYENRFSQMLQDAKMNHWAVAAFNIVNGQTLRAVLYAAEKTGRPIIIQTSMGTVRKLGAEALGGMVNAARSLTHVQIALHLDHCRDDAMAKECIRFGWDAVMMDYSLLPLDENIEKMKAITDYAHEHDVAVEGEIGLIKGVEEDISSDSEQLANYEDTVLFIKSTGIDAIAPAIGTAHGQYTKKPKINFDLVERLSYLDTPIVVHGGTGLEDEVFRRLVRCGAAKINISTAVKASYIAGMRKALETGSKDPLTCDEVIEKEVETMAERLINLFAGKDE